MMVARFVTLIVFALSNITDSIFARFRTVRISKCVLKKQSVKMHHFARVNDGFGSAPALLSGVKIL
jgi:hypothetical protein